MFGVEGILV